MQHSSTDLSYTPIMEPVKLSSMEWPGDPHVNLNKLARLGYHDVYVETTRDHKPKSYPDFPSVYPPDEHLMCIDFLYWASILQPFEWETRCVTNSACCGHHSPARPQL